MSENIPYNYDDEFFDNVEGDEEDFYQFFDDEEYENADDGEVYGEGEDDYEDMIESEYNENFEFSDDSFDDIDFSQFNGDDFKSAFSQVSGALERGSAKRKMISKRKPPVDVKVKKVIAGEGREVIIEGQTTRQPAQKRVQRVRKPIVQKRRQSADPVVQSKPTKNILRKRPVRKAGLTKDVSVRREATIQGPGKKLANIIVPAEKKVIVEGVNKFILSKDVKDDSARNIGYYKGKKLKELVLTFNNDSALDFNLEIFNPSAPLDYLYSTSLNLNDKVQVAGGYVSYSDVLFNLLANPTLIPNARFVISGPNVIGQTAQALQFKNKEITGKVKIHPVNLSLSLDNMQVFTDIVNFDIQGALNRPFVPDGMDVIQYKVLAGMTVTMAFFYKQVSLKKVLLKEARNSKKLL